MVGVETWSPALNGSAPESTKTTTLSFSHFQSDKKREYRNSNTKGNNGENCNGYGRHYENINNNMKIMEVIFIKEIMILTTIMATKK